MQGRAPSLEADSFSLYRAIFSLFFLVFTFPSAVHSRLEYPKAGEAKL